MFGFISSALQSAFTPAGTNARRDQEAGQKSVADQARDIAKRSGTNYDSVLKYLQSKQGNVQGGIDALGRMTTRGGLRDQALRAGSTARGQAMSSQVPIQYAGNPALANAYRSRAMNAATGVQNQALQNSTSPLAQTQALMQLLQAMNSYQSQSYAPYGQAAGLVYGQPQVQVQPGIMDQLGPIIGAIKGAQSVGQGKGGAAGATQARGGGMGMGGSSQWYTMPDGAIEDQFGNRMSRDEFDFTIGNY
jgi:hypothetical protein